MRDLLKYLLQRRGVLGAMAVTREGIPLLTEVRPPLELPAAALAVSNIARSAIEEARRLGASDVKRLTIEAGSRYVQLVDSADCYLAVISQGPFDLEKAMLDFPGRLP